MFYPSGSMRKTWYAMAVASMIIVLACSGIGPVNTAARVIETYRQELKELLAETRRFVQLADSGAGMQALQQEFKKARTAYKKIEWLTEYYYPYTAKSINGPALAEVEAEEKNIVVQPEGFQVIEAMLFTAGPSFDKGNLLLQAKVLHSNVGRLQNLIAVQETTDAHVFDALRLELFRIITLGITGFDSPVAGTSLEEAAAALKSVARNLSFYRRMDEKTGKLLESAMRELASKDFNSLDRMQFITQYLNPLSEYLMLLQQDLAVSFFTEPRLLRADANTLFDKAIFNADFYTPGVWAYSNPNKVALGRKLFYDGILSGNGRRSCATCHEPSKAFTDGLTTSLSANERTPIRRNAPTLINAALQPSLFYDMRVSYLEDQAKDVISNKDEMHGSLDSAIKWISKNTVYRKLFSEVYKSETVSEMQVKNSIAAYVRSLVRMDSRFDRYMRGDRLAMNKMEVDGFNVFTGKAKCATCHFIPLFNGANPPQFGKTDAEVIGVPAGADSLHPVLDEDEGKYNLYKVDLHIRAFKTPGLRNIGLTAPYMHNGAFKTLEDVVEFYNRGGGAGLGLDVSNQTLAADKLNLSAYEKKSLVAFMKTLTDTSSVR